MKSLTALFVGLFLSALPAQAQNLVNAMELLKMENEQVMERIEGDRITAQVVKKIEKKQKVSSVEVENARRHCDGELAKIGTPRLRKKMIKGLMSKIDDEILQFVDSRRDGFEMYEGRQLSARISRRMKSLLEFEAERCQRFLEVLKSSP
ncbi:hypothetical protein HZA41_01580 [Candidatus Peregrinibacteria bacterium]|nr:hypothetical protein [Candidatus Peregrinibacteria bacterium]